MSEIVVTSFRFPPVGGVGGRRWAKFSKYLARNGHVVHVICADLPWREAVTWERDVIHENIKVHRVHPGCPVWVLNPRKGFLGRKAAPFVRRTFYPIDVAQRWGAHLVPYAVKLVRERKARTMIVSGPPSSVHYAGAFVKTAEPSVRLIQDYRDLWNSDRDYELGKGLRRFADKERSIQMELMAVTHADFLVYATREMMEKNQLVYRMPPDRCRVIFNGYDPDDAPPGGCRNPDRFNLYYAGGIGVGPNLRSRALELIAEAVVAANDEFLAGNLLVDLRGNLHASLFESHPRAEIFRRNFRFRGWVTPETVMEETAGAAFCLSINAPVDSQAHGSKIFDYLGCGKRVLHISSGGELNTILRSRGHYACRYDVGEIKSALLSMAEEYRKGIAPIPPPEDFSIPHLTRQYEDLIV